jgi:co-chaperonin GroES (HSP10)
MSRAVYDDFAPSDEELWTEGKVVAVGRGRHNNSHSSHIATVATELFAQ